MEHFDKEFQAEVIDEDIADGHKEIPDNLCPTTQSGARETDVPRHPKTCEESNGEFEHKGRDVGRKGDETEVKHLSVKHIVVENIIQHPFQSQIQATASRITEQFEAHELAERRIEEVDDRGQSAFHPEFYVFEG